MNVIKNRLDHPDFHEYFHYEKETGNLIHKKKYARVEKGSAAGWMNAYGYKMVTCCKMKFMFHRVVWLMNHGEWPSMQINHINGIKTDNRIENLENVSNQENRDHAVKHNLHHKGATKRSKFTETDIPIMFERRKSGETIKSIAESYCVHRETIGQILRGYNWKHVKVAQELK